MVLVEKFDRLKCDAECPFGCEWIAVREHKSIRLFVWQWWAERFMHDNLCQCDGIIQNNSFISKTPKNCVEKKFDCKIQSATEFKASNKPNLRSQILIISLQQFYQILCLFALYCASFRSIKAKMTHRFLQFQRIICDWLKRLAIFKNM